ncbi:cytochrome P450 [Streptomyces bungoensis]|uniref:cytochrome P450 n=1 Tax=Streptomyces bungoensis TaxID=285568 RepID=UPI000A7CB85A|nr:cytochrome P450 [Streptomyces bungoensis]
MDGQHQSPRDAGCPLYDDEFAAHPQRVYERVRARGPAGPVQLAPGVDATLVVGHGTALEVLRDPTLFARDARRWTALNEGRVSADSPVLPMMAYRPNCLFTDGAAHLRLRKAVTESLARLSTTRIHRDVEPVAAYLIGRFGPRGHADLIDDYARLLPLLLFTKFFDCPADIGDTLTTAMSAVFDGHDVLRADQDLTACLAELIALKRLRPGDDVTSWLIQHPAALTDDELKDQLVMLLGASVEPERNLIGSALLLLLSDSGSSGAGLLVDEAVDRVLWNDPPLANYATHYPVRDVDLGGVTVAAGTPVLISFAGANSDPALAEARQAYHAGAHLAWGAGPHACPVKDPARAIATTAVETLLNALPDLTLAVPAERLRRRPGPFHRALASLPVRFSPVPAVRTASVPRDRSAAATAAEQPRPTACATSGGRDTAVRKGFWSSFLDMFRS